MPDSELQAVRTALVKGPTTVQDEGKLWRIRKRPILPLTESARNDGDLIGLVAEVGNVLLERGAASFCLEADGCPSCSAKLREGVAYFGK